MTEDTSPENLRKFLESDDPAMVQMGLSMSKGAGLPEELLPTILRLYMWNDNKTIRAAAKSVFNKNAPAEIQAKVKENWQVKYRTISVKNHFDKFPEAVRPFLEAFKSQDNFSIIALEPLIKALEDKHWWTRKNAAEALGKIGDKRAVEPLLSFWIKILEDGIGNIGRNNEFARESAVRALIKIGDGAVEPLIKALGDKEEDVRRYTARVLGNIGGKRAVEPLIKALEDKDSEVRQRAATSLGWIGDKRAVEPLIKALEDKDSEVRRFTAIALGRIGDKRAVEPLIKALGDKDEYVRNSAAYALKKLGHDVK